MIECTTLPTTGFAHFWSTAGLVATRKARTLTGLQLCFHNCSLSYDQRLPKTAKNGPEINLATQIVRVTRTRALKLHARRSTAEYSWRFAAALSQLLTDS